jgi:hypothetical protein
MNSDMVGFPAAASSIAAASADIVTGMYAASARAVLAAAVVRIARTRTAAETNFAALFLFAVSGRVLSSLTCALPTQLDVGRVAVAPINRGPRFLSAQRAAAW